MHYELWGYETGNLICTFEAEAEAEALAFVRDLLEDGWDANELGLGLMPSEGDPEDVELPPVLEGASLVERVRAFYPDVRLSA